MAVDRANQTIILPDGRKLGFAEWGDLNGKPVFLFAGSTSARFSRHPDESIIQEMGVHLYTFDRPGMGLSDFQPDRILLHWAKDMRDFADQKEIERFAIVAASQGGPYGAVCAYGLENRLSSVTLVSAVSPMDDREVYNAQNGGIKMVINLGRHAPWLYELMLNLARPMVMRGKPEQLLRGMLNNLPESDQKILSAPELMNIMAKDVQESVRQGGKGAAHDVRVCVTDWGFKLEDIQTKVFIWQGEDDRNVPPIMARYFAARIPNCETTFISDAGHFLMFSHWRQILAQLLAVS